MEDGKLLEWIVKTVITFICSAATLGFVQNLINRNDRKKEKAEQREEKKQEKKDQELRELKERIEEVNDEREDVGKRRYEEHQRAIAELREENELARQESKEAVEELRQMLKSLAETVEKQADVTAKHQEIDNYRSELIVALVQDKLFFYADKYQRRGAITLDELAIMRDMYKPYHDKLGGNGRGKAGMELCESLPRITADEAKELDKEGKRYDKQSV